MMAMKLSQLLAGLEFEAQEDGTHHAYEATGDLTCPICLEVPEPADMALVKGCEHMYCVNCILKWACSRECVTCPKCKAPFSYLLVHRQLDGSITDYPTEESLCLLKRASWFTEHVRTTEFGPKIAADDCVYDDEYDLDEDEDEYYAYTAGRARSGNSSRIIIGNRRWGENGSVRSGRMYARPVATTLTAPAAGKSGKGSKSAGSSGTVSGGGSSGAGPSLDTTGSAVPPVSAPEQTSTSAVAVPVTTHGAAELAACTATSPSIQFEAGSVIEANNGAQKQGRRAKRAARRAAADLADDYDYDDRYSHYADRY